MSRKGDMNDIETAKENILPIRQGRRADIMCSVLSNKGDQAQHERRSYFENELRSYTGDDPLKIWLEYISWIEQNCITGGKDYNVAELTKKCLFALKDKEIYKDDPRIFPIWLKFANANTDPLEVFNYMATNGFCLKLAHFYVEWAWKLEAVGNLKAANAVLQDGINIGAKPLEAIQHAIWQLDRRSVKAIQELQPSEAAAVEGVERRAFNKLKPQGKKHLAPVMRVGDYVQEKGHFLSSVESIQKQSKSSGPFKIYQGDSENPLPAPSSQRGAPSYIFNPSGNKENVRKPDKWTNVKPSKWMRPPQSTGTRDLGFVFHCDEDQEGEGEPKAVIPKTPLTDEFAALSVKKGSACNPAIALFEEPNPNSRPMYDKVKVYCGGTEFSFEEIRAAVWFRQQREQAEADSEEWIHKQQKMPQEMKDNCKVSEESDSVTSRDGEKKLCCENTAQGPDLENMLALEGGVHYSHFQSSSVKVGAESHAPGSHCMHDENLSPRRSPPCDGMTADIRGMMQSLSMGSPPNENCHISKYADMGHAEINHSVLSHKSVLGSLDGVQQKGYLDNQKEQPFQIYCDVMEDDLRTTSPQPKKVSTQNVPDGIDQPPVYGTVYAEKGHSTCSNKIASVPDTVDEEAQEKQNLSQQRVQPFQIYCDATEDLRAASLQPRANVDVQNIPSWKEHTQRIHDIENIPPADYYKKDKVLNSDDLVQLPSGSTALVGSHPSSGTFVEEEKIDCDAAEEQENYTIIPPPDTQHFMLNAFMASTPHAKSKPSVSSCSKDTSPVPSYPFEEDIAPQIHKVTDGLPTDTKAEVEDSAVAKEGLLAFSHHSASTVSPRPPSSPQQADQLSCRIFEAGSNVVSKPPIAQQTEENEEVHPEDDAATDVDKLSLRTDVSKGFEVATLDPFDKKSHQICLQKIKKPLDQWDNYYTASGSVKTVEHGGKISFGDENYLILRYLGKGSFATVYQAELQASFLPRSGSHHQQQKKKVALKVGLPGIEWEFYICSVLHARHENSPGIDVRDSVMKVHKLLSFNDGRVIMTDLCEYGTLVDMVNSYRIVLQEPVPEAMVMYLTFQLLCIVSKIHKLGILHGDLKPDNFLVAQVPTAEEAIGDLWTKTHCVRLIDFGRGVDLSLFKPKTAFLTRSKVFGRARNRCHIPFLYEADWFGAADIIHTLLFSQYMKVQRNELGIIMPMQRFKRYWHTEKLWEPLFQKLLNLSVDEGEPDVMPFLQFIASKLNPQDLTLPFLRLKQQVRRGW